MLGRFIRMRSSSLHPRPRLPVPDLHNTLKKYLKSLEPLLLEDEAHGGPCHELSIGQRVQWAEKFENGIGKLCQERLLALDRMSPHNWLEDNFWLKKAYHEGRSPLLINSNWWLAFHNDDQVPYDVLMGRSEPSQTGITPWQIRRATWLVHRTLEFKDRLDSEEHHPETTRTGIWLRESTAKMFNIGRIPQENCDTLSPVPPPSHPDSKKILLMLHDWLYSVDVYDDVHQNLLKVGEIEKRFRAVVADATSRIARGERAIPVGLLSADRRDIWAKNLDHLLSLSHKNREIHRTILQSLLCLSLDHYSHVTPQSSSHLSSTTPTPLNSPAEVDSHLHNIRSGYNGRNRWFDKAFTLIVESNTSAGAMGEHSPVDALVPSIVAEYAVVQGMQEDAFGYDVYAAERLSTPTGWNRLDWVVDAKTEQECVNAEERAKKLIDNSDDSVYWFTDYGTDWMKAVAKTSPDAFLQMVLQLAWYKTRGTFTATYETALTRMFHQGRTETIRTLTTESRAFVLAMFDPTKSTSDRYRLLQRAIQVHTSLTREAATGKGIDRHLLGLQEMLRQSDGQLPELFDDELWYRSKQWKLSTSGLSAGHLFRGTGFGAAYEDGYGINYLAAPELVKFGIESKFSSYLTSTAQFKDAIREAMLDMKSLCPVDVRDVLISSSL